MVREKGSLANFDQKTKAVVSPQNQNRKGNIKTKEIKDYYKYCRKSLF